MSQVTGQTVPYLRHLRPKRLETQRQLRARPFLPKNKPSSSRQEEDSVGVGVGSGVGFGVGSGVG